ncbi:LytTR family DNA-binding domain-containing protein [Lactobacillus bombicola]|uniref:LytTR family DNA-binding domain-containing protein n=1 Tax=Lactobacillus bombicola TaxID=1505723 RepID=UPI000E577966|nr:LytTR family DNA-binding domain-containing protein [Lactobacillus bombicola]RHW51536.1 LytTR family transcriptional regulator [Lactobacillus bombicola]
MKINFQRDPSVVEGEIQVEIRAQEDDGIVKNLIKYLEKFGEKSRNLIPVKTTDRIVTIKYNNLIKIEVQATNLTYYTTNEIVKTTGRLYQVLESLDDDFIQVSRHSVINLNYLESIEGGFAGNMIAILSDGLKADVSRRYLPQLERELGL